MNVSETRVAILTEEITAARRVAFENFALVYRERAVRTAYRLSGGDASVAEDIAQEAFARAFRSYEGFRSESSMETWFFRILTRQAANYRRWRGMRRRWQHFWSKGEGSQESAIASDPPLRDVIAAAMKRLSPRQLEVFTLVRLEGFGIKDVCVILGCAEGTAKTHLHRAQQSLREDLLGVWREFNEEQE